MRALAVVLVVSLPSCMWFFDDDDAPPDAYVRDGRSGGSGNCPSDFREPDATCTPGASCEYDDWEHGCSCACQAWGRWSCTPETIGSRCPTNPPPDAGVDAP